MTSPTSTEIARKGGYPCYSGHKHKTLDSMKLCIKTEVWKAAEIAIDSAIEAEREAICKLCCEKCEVAGSYVLKVNADGNWGHYGTLTRDIIPCAAQAIRARSLKSSKEGDK